jgi:hypothetical protein
VCGHDKKKEQNYCRCRPRELAIEQAEFVF